MESNVHLTTEQIQQLIQEQKRRLFYLQQRRARMGYNAPPEVLTEIDDILAEITKLEQLFPSRPNRPQHDVDDSRTITWLHLSDLHFQTAIQHTWDENIVLQALLTDITDCIQQDSLHLDFIACTGDIAFSGKPAEYDLAKHFFDRLLQTTNLDKNRLFLVPGNHDLDRTLVTSGAQATGDSLQDREKTNAILMDPVGRRSMMARFKGYTAFFNDYLGEYLTFDDERYFYVQPLELAEQRIALLGLNSAWLCASDQDEVKRLVISEYQVRIALEQAKNADLKIALLHHPFDLLRQFDRNDVEPLLYRRCDFILHGHMHQLGILQARTPDTEAMIIAAGACYKTRNYPNSYNVVQLDLNNERGSIHLRMYSDRQGGFWTKDVLNYRNVSDGRYDFEFTTHQTAT